MEQLVFYMVKSILPKSFSVRIFDSKTNNPTPNVLICATLLVPRKNSYSSRPHITDSRGEVEFTGDEFRSEIKLNRRVFLMDYCCDESDVIGVEICVLPTDQIERMITFSEQWSDMVPEWNLTDNFIATMRASINNQLISQRKTFSLPNTNDVLNLTASRIVDYT